MSVLDEGEMDPEMSVYEGHGTVLDGWLLGTKLDITI